MTTKKWVPSRDDRGCISSRRRLQLQHAVAGVVEALERRIMMSGVQVYSVEPLDSDWQQGETGYTLGTNTIHVEFDKVKAASPVDAVKAAVAGSIYVETTSQNHTFSSGGVAFKIGTIGAIASQVGTDFDKPTGWNDNTVVIALEDQTDSEPNDLDFDDWFLRFSAIPATAKPDCGCAGQDKDYSNKPVRYYDGSVRHETMDLPGITRTVAGKDWLNDMTANRVGQGFTLTQLPSLAQMDGDNDIATIDTGTSLRYFHLDAGQYQPQGNVLDGLVHSGTEFISTDTAGNRTVYNDFGVSPTGKRGQFKQWVDTGGNTLYVVSYNAAGNPEEVRLKDAAGTDRQSWVYTYISSGTNAGLVDDIMYRVSDGSSGWTNARQVDYTYYDGIVSYGLAGDLKLAQIKDASANVVETKYYRWYTSDTSTGYEHGLQMIFEGASYDRLYAATGNALTASESTAKNYANNYFEYDGDQQVTLELAQGEGCSCGGSTGQGTFTYEYTYSSFEASTSSWAVKTVETLENGNVNTVFTNGYGQVMLKLVDDGEDTWGDFYTYDANGRMTLAANTSALDLPGSVSTLEQYPDLLNKVSGNYEYLRDSAGLIQTYSYYSSTTAGTSTAGSASGYYQSTAIKRGETGMSITQETVDYLSRTSGSNTIYVVANTTVYSATNATDARTTTNAYTWQGTTAAVLELTTTLPTVGSGHNGSGTAISNKIVFDLYGRPTWTKDGSGFLTRTSYDAITGGITQVIADVDTSQTSDEPSGWSTPSGGGLHLITAMEVDTLGRPTRTTDPNGNDTYTIYKDASHEVRSYVGWNSTTKRPTGPTYVVREDWTNKYSESLSMTAAPATNGAGLPTGGESISDVQSLTRTFVNNADQVTQVDRYFSFSGLSYSSGTSLGTLNSHFYRAEYGYDKHGLVNRIVAPTGTITRLIHDTLGRLSTTWIGTDDTPSSGYFTATNTAGTDLTKVEERFYDTYDFGYGSGVGDSNLTGIAQFTNDYDARLTEFFHDWRNRLVATSIGKEFNTGSPLNITYQTLDNLNQVTQSELYDGNGISMTGTNNAVIDANSDGVPDAPSSSNRRTRDTFDYDELGQLWRSQTFSVTQSGSNAGTVSSNSLKNWFWYDNRGNLIKTLAPGGLTTKYKIDGAGRVIKQYLTDGGGDATPGTSGSWDNATHVTGDNVLEQVENQYDSNSNLIFAISKLHFHDDANTGELSNISGTPKARVSYGAFYYDKANRLTDSVDVGTNAGSSYTLPSNAPTNRSNTLLLTHTDYDDANRVVTVTDPRGIASKSYSDMLGRTTKTIAAYVDGTPSSADDQTTEYTYDGSDHVLTMKAVLPNSGTNSVFQTTQYVYGVDKIGNGDIVSNDLLKEIRYPDKTTGSASTNSANVESFTLNALGEVKELTDRNGTIRQLTRDNLGRLTADQVSASGFGSGVDQTVEKLAWAYDGAGRLSTLTSHAPYGAVVNQISREYNGYGQMTAEYQAHSGTVSTSVTPKVQYVYSEGGTDVSDNDSRLTKMIYPNGRVLRYEYGTTGALNEKVSRLAFLADEANNSPSTHIEEYSYLGYSTVVIRNRPSANSKLTYLSGETSGEAGDQYTGLDRFGRIIDQHWVTQSVGNPVTLDRFQYAYDANSNPLYKKNLLDSTFSELYHANGTNSGYDSLNRLTDFRRGTLSDANSDGVFDTVSTLNTLAGSQKNWNLDAVGNWNSETTDGTAVNRTHDAQNELTAVGATNLTYDNAGSLTVDQEGRGLVYDAWNRLVTVLDEPEGSAVQSYAYDAAGRRISHSASTATDLYYSAGWQLLEERQSGSAKNQYVWSPTYIDELILRDQYGVSTAGTLDTTFGSGGITYTDLGAGNPSDAPYSVAVQADGKIVVAGDFIDGSDQHIAILRYNVDGSLDTSFDSDGVLLMDLSEYGEMVLGVAIQPDGKIVLAGTIGNGTDGDLLLVRLHPDGSADTSFGTNDDGVVITDYNAYDQFESLTLQADGKIVAVGNVLARYNSDGSLDTSFDSDGIQSSVSGHVAAITSDGKIVVAGTASEDFRVTRVTTSGSLDTTFDSDGIATADLGNNEVGLALAIQADDKIVVGGYSENETHRDFALARFTTSGSLDTSFDSDGKVLTDFASESQEQAHALAIQPDGKIVAAGTHYYDTNLFAVARYNPDGSLDTSFSGDGKAVTSVRVSAYGRSVIQADGRIIVAGLSDDEYGDGAFGVAVFRSGLPQRLNAQTDANHNVTSIADVFADVKQRTVYDPYGNVTVLTSGWATTTDSYNWGVRHQGLRFDPITGLYDNRGRPYSPKLGRATSVDPLGNPDGPSRYQYVMSSPVNMVDPSGLEGLEANEYLGTFSASGRPYKLWRGPTEESGREKRALGWIISYRTYYREEWQVPMAYPDNALSAAVFKDAYWQDEKPVFAFDPKNVMECYDGMVAEWRQTQSNFVATARAAAIENAGYTRNGLLFALGAVMVGAASEMLGGGGSRSAVPNPNGRNGTAAHQADVAANNMQQSGNLVPMRVGNRIPDGVGKPNQTVTIRGTVITPQSAGRPIVESERLCKNGIPVSEGRRQIRDIRSADTKATIIVTDPDNTGAAPLVYPPRTQPPPGGRLPRNTPPIEEVR